jgi:hypothetical protein
MGDSGGGSSKVAIEPMNVCKGNSCFNTYLLARYPGKDSAYNVKAAFRRIFKELEEMAGENIEVMGQDGRMYAPRIRFFLGGDLAWLYTLVGHCGQSSRFFCALCHCQLEDIQTPGKAHSYDDIGVGLRTLETIAGKRIEKISFPQISILFLMATLYMHRTYTLIFVHFFITHAHIIRSFCSFVFN